MLIIPNSVIQGDCLEVMPYIEAGSIDMILADLPYGTTACKWDSIIPFEPLWKEYKRIIKPNGAIVLTASQPFTSALVMSNPKMFNCSWVWQKNMCANGINGKRQPLKFTEDILVFGKCITYNPILEDKPRQNIQVKNYTRKFRSNVLGKGRDTFGINDFRKIPTDKRYPGNILKIDTMHGMIRKHPSEKPIALFEYLIKTYSNENDLVLDNTAGSGTTAIAAINTDRRYILIEKEAEYIEVCNKRIEEALQRKQAA